MFSLLAWTILTAAAVEPPEVAEPTQPAAQRSDDDGAATTDDPPAAAEDAPAPPEAEPVDAPSDAPAEPPAPAGDEVPEGWVAPPPPPMDSAPLFDMSGAAPVATEPGGFSFSTGSPTTTGEAPKSAKPEFTFGGIVQYDLRFRTEKQRYGSYYQTIPDPATLSRNEVMSKFRWSAKLAKYGMKGDVDFYIRALPKTETLYDLTQYNVNNPFRFEMHDLYMYGRDMFGAKGLDVRIGQQKAMFGVGDQFNPTNNVNANDLEDVLLFGDQQGNLMARVDYSPLWNLMLTGLLVPVFKPALVPDSGYLAQTPDRYPFLSEELRWNLGAEQATGDELFGYPTIVRDVKLQLPEFSAKNMQFFFRAGGTFGGQDIAVSYYNGRSDVPQAVYNITSQVEAPACNPLDASDCVNGVLASDVILAFPKMQVLGLNMAGEINPFGKVHKSFKPIGYRFELAFIFPEETRLRVVQDNVQFLFVTKDGEYDYPNGDNRIIDSRPFAKWVLGLDYQFNRFIYMNTQWVHGFVDEFGAGDFIQPGWQVRGSDVSAPGDCAFDLASFSGQGKECAREWLKPRLGDYLVWGTDIKFLQNSLTLRIFTIWDLLGVYRSTWDAEAGQRKIEHRGMFTKEGFSAVIFPSLMYNFGNGLEVHGGALLEFGKPWTKFGAPETGGHQLWLRARYSY